MAIPMFTPTSHNTSSYKPKEDGRMKISAVMKTTISALLLSSAITSFAGNLTVSKNITVNASPETTWKMIGNFNHLDVWHPVVVDSQLVKGDGQSPGSLRLLTLGNGATITEKLVSHNDSAKRYTYAIVKSPLPVSDYVSTISVSPAANGKATVTWNSTFDAKGAEDAEAVKTISGIYDAGLKNLDKHFNQ